MNDTLREIFADWIDSATTDDELAERTAAVKTYFPEFNY